MVTSSEIKIEGKIVVLGGTGHLGSSLIHHLVNGLNFNPKDIRVFYLAGSSTGSLNDLDGLDMFPGNILNKDDVEAVCSEAEHTLS